MNKTLKGMAMAGLAAAFFGDQWVLQDSIYFKIVTLHRWI